MGELISHGAAIEAERQKIKASGSISRADAINAVLDLCKKCDSCHCGDCLVYAPNTNIYDVIDLLTDLPSTERVGKWKYETMSHIMTGEMRTVRICSVCDGGWFCGVEEAEPNFCPNCGADMRGEEDE